MRFVLGFLVGGILVGGMLSGWALLHSDVMYAKVVRIASCLQ